MIAPPILDPYTAAWALAVLNPRRLYHRAEVQFADRLPASGGEAEAELAARVAEALGRLLEQHGGIPTRRG